MKSLAIIPYIYILCLLSPLPAIASTPFGSDSLWLAELEKEGAATSDNNRIVFFKNGTEKFTDLFEAVRQAKSSIHMEYFNFRDDSIANALFDLLEIKVKEGVEVRLLFDAFGNSSNNKPIRKKKLKELQDRGINIQKYHPARFPWFTYAFARDHRKIVIIDGKTAYSGGMNVADYYIKGKPEIGEWRDMHFRIEGDAVAEYQRIFLRIWERTTGEKVHGAKYYPGMSFEDNALKGLKKDTTLTAGRKKVVVINREPQVNPKIMRRVFVDLLNSAQYKVQLINPYFTLRHSVRKALKKALERGVEVEIIVSEKCDIPITPRIVDCNVRKLQKRGAKVYYFQGGFHHSKIMMIDDKTAFVGSANLDSRSLFWDFEVNALILDEHSTHELQRIFNYDKTHRCVPLTEEYWKSKPKGQRFWGWFFQILEPFVWQENPQIHLGKPEV